MPSWRNAMGLYDPWNDDDNENETIEEPESNAGRGFDTGFSLWIPDPGQED